MFDAFRVTVWTQSFSPCSRVGCRPLCYNPFNYQNHHLYGRVVAIMEVRMKQELKLVRCHREASRL